MFSDEVPNNWSTSANHHLVHLVDCTNLYYSMVLIHYGSSSINLVLSHILPLFYCERLLYFEVVNPIQEYPDLQFCQEKWPGGEVYQTAYFIVANVIFCYLLPLLLIFICYIMIWMKVSNRSIPTENKDAQLERMQQRSKVLLLIMPWLHEIIVHLYLVVLV